MRDKVLDIARKVYTDRHPQARVLFAAGSILRGEGTPFSDLDLVVLYERLPNGYRESFTVEGLPVETFVHDPETLEHILAEDRENGIPAIAHMIHEGVAIPQTNGLSQALKHKVALYLADGPSPRTAQREYWLRYSITNLVDDLRDPRGWADVAGAGTLLYQSLADFHLRRQGCWSGQGKSIVRLLRKHDPDLGMRYQDAFMALCSHAETGPVIRLAEELLAPAGGFLFDGYHAEMDADCRQTADPAVLAALSADGCVPPDCDVPLRL
jgi:hypothetical protein